MRVCNIAGCPTLYSDSDARCPAHRKEADKARGQRHARGYGTAHDQLRAEWLPKVATGTIRCARCGEHIAPRTPWALDHSDDRTHYLGPSHLTCNASAGGRAAHR